MLNAFAGHEAGFPLVEAFGSTVSCRGDEAPALAWHRPADLGATRPCDGEPWYDHYEVRVAKVERACGSKPAR